MKHQTQTADIAAPATFTTPIAHKAGEWVAASVSGSFVATATLQRSLDDGATWDDLASSTAPTGWNLQMGASGLVRLGCKAGGYTSGTLHSIVKYG